MYLNEKWAIGSKWRIDSGCCATVVDRNEETGCFCVACNDAWFTVSDAGRFCFNHQSVIGPWEEELDIVVGGTYLTAGGDQVLVVAILTEALKTEYPVIGLGFTKTGYGYVAHWGIDGASEPGVSKLVKRIA